MKKLRVGVLRGGPSNEYDVSLDTGFAVLKNLPDHYEPVDVFIDKSGAWHIHGVRHEVQKVLRRLDVIFNATHGHFGEDGQLAELLERFGSKYTGSRPFPARLAMNKAVSKEFLARYGIKTPIARLISKNEFDNETASKLYRSFPQPSVIKPAYLGSSLGISVVQTTDELQAALMNAFSHADSAIIEEYIKGREAACSVIDRFNNEEFYAMPPVQVIQKAGSRLYDYDAKYKDGPEAICPGEFSLEEADAIRDIAKRVHQALGLRHYSKSDFIVHPKRGIYFLEANSQPKFGHSTFTTGANGARIPMADIIDHIVQLALSS